MATVHRFENLQRHKAASRVPTADLPVLDPDGGIESKSYASEPWNGLGLVFAWSLAAVIGWGILAAVAWGLVYGIHWLWQAVTP
jgi:hypothetical protein